MITQGVYRFALSESVGSPAGTKLERFAVASHPTIFRCFSPPLRYTMPRPCGRICLKAPIIRARYTLAILFAINLLNFYDRHIPAAVVEPLRKDWGLSDAQIGWLMTAFTLLYAVIGVPFGRLSDRFQRSMLLGLGVAVWSLLTAASGLAWNYGVLF